MSEEKSNLSRANKELVIANETTKKSWRKNPLFLVVLFLTVLIVVPLAYGFANGYFEVSYIKPEDRAYNIQKQKQEMKSEIAELSKQKEILEQKRERILEQLNKTKTLVEQSKNSSPEVDAHIQVVTSTCKSCRTPAWIESYRAAFASLEEIGKIIDEDNSSAPVK